MQIKELLQSLVDDGLVNAEKCGITVVYWCFEYDKIKTQKDLLVKKRSRISTCEEIIAKLSNELSKEVSARNRGDGAEKSVLLESLQRKKAELSNLLDDSVFDADKVHALKTELNLRISTAEVCTDNIESIIYHFSKKNDIKRDFFEKELSIPGEFTSLPDIEAFFRSLK